tara:strand:+ start:516 stop:692 length:177 start_codon:yes stop_codon:yes gene_type:complete
MLILEYFIGITITIFMLTMSYVGIHMAFEKDAGKYFPLIWEKDGLLEKLKIIVRKNDE